MEVDGEESFEPSDSSNPEAVPPPTQFSFSDGEDEDHQGNALNLLVALDFKIEKKIY